MVCLTPGSGRVVVAFLSGVLFACSSPPPPPPPLYLFTKSGTPKTIWPVGDSLTYGVESTGANNGGYRVPLKTWWNGLTYINVYVGTQNGPPTGYLNDGHSGFTAEQINTVTQADLPGHVAVPDAVIWWGGINNCNEEFGPYDGAATAAAIKTALQYIQTQAAAVAIQTYIFCGTVSDIQDAGKHANVLDLNSRLTDPGGIFDQVDATRPHGAPLLQRVDFYTALGGRFSAPNYDTVTGNLHLTPTGYTTVASAIEAVATASGLLQP